MRFQFSIIIILLILYSCSSDSPNEQGFIIVQDSIVSNKNWTINEDIPEFNIKLHSDGCSGGMSAIYSELEFLHDKHGKTLEWRHCCETHDEAYYYGGSKKQKLIADENLASCVTKVVGNQFLGQVMKIAVDIGGGPNLPTPYRWGYGEDFRD